VAVILVGLAATAAACGATPAAHPGTTPAATRPVSVVPAPAGLLGGGPPQPDGSMWVLAGTGGARTLQRLDLTSGRVSVISPVSAAAATVAQSSSGVLGVGLATRTAGALELHNGANGTLMSTVALAAPARDVVAGSGGTTFYVLAGTPSAAGVTLVNATTGRAGATVPVPAATVALAVDPAEQNLYALGPGGQVSVVAVGNGAVVAHFPAGPSGRALALSSDGQTLYVLEGNGAVDDVAVLKTATERQVTALPAPADAVDLQLSLDGHLLYELVGSPSVGNIQAFPAGR